MDRKQKALAYVDLDGRGLEIGPSYDPLLPKSSGARVETVDHADAAELIEKYRGYGVPPDKIAAIENVDHIWVDGSLVDVVGERGAFDYILASHVIEHMVDLIGFLQDCEALLHEGGALSLVIPDKRFCFDYLQPLTTVGTAVDGHHAGARVHPPGTVIDHFLYGTQRGPGVIAWDRATQAPMTLQCADLDSCREVLGRARRQEEYIDVHRWRFTPTSFRLLLHDLRELGYHELTEVGAFDTDGFEFFVTLARTEAAPPTDDRLTMLLRIQAELDSVVESSTQETDGGMAAELDRLRADLSACEQRLDVVLASRSWRVTRPLRALSRVRRR